MSDAEKIQRLADEGMQFINARKPRLYGTVDRFDASRSTAFIRGLDGKEYLAFRLSDTRPPLEIGNLVLFRPNNLRADDITVEP